MISAFFSRLGRVRFTVGYVASLAAVSTALLMLSPQAHDRLIRHASTNLHNLAHGRLLTLLGSAFVVEAGPLYFWMPFLACLLALVELHLRTIRLFVAFLVGHIGATLVVAAALAGGVEFGLLPRSIARASDVGMSYGALAALGALTAAIPRRWQPAWIGWWISLSVAAAFIGGEFTNAGHAVALMLGILVAVRFRLPVHWTPVRCLMLLGSAGFGFLLLAHSWWTMSVGLVLGGLGAVAAHEFARWLDLRGATAPDEALTAPQPALSA
ncbi:rhomboid-like protein [Mycobacterium sp. 1423905.2]|uniref:rhomboid-like protein n=1 Tax=Mycobacterium sp. 1423905.2 TaxID=1856859 RepID=UPI000800C83D|nr:rhomboid-like protein [Mycobacterium sp. 1423905.2]OBJ60601.1 hypothetical protein A9W95_10115 [Mycobacterium sp. 1423905.2]